MFEQVKRYQDPEGFVYHYFTASNGVITVNRIAKSGVTGKGFENKFEAEMYLKGKRAELIA